MSVLVWIVIGLVYIWHGFRIARDRRWLHQNDPDWARHSKFFIVGQYAVTMLFWLPIAFAVIFFGLLWSMLCIIYYLLAGE